MVIQILIVKFGTLLTRTVTNTSKTKNSIRVDLDIALITVVGEIRGLRQNILVAVGVPSLGATAINGVTISQGQITGTRIHITNKISTHMIIILLPPTLKPPPPKT